MFEVYGDSPWYEVGDIFGKNNSTTFDGKALVLLMAPLEDWINGHVNSVVS